MTSRSKAVDTISMANLVGQVLKQTAVDLGEAVVKPVADEVGKAIEEGAQSVVGFTVNSTTQQHQPQADRPLDEKQLENQKRKQWALKVIDWNKKIQESQAKVHQEEQQKITQQTREEEEKKKVKQFKVMEKQQKQQQLSVAQVAERRAEIKKGVGG